jgi:DNA (cytosine-5)-methyltransferase 1
MSIPLIDLFAGPGGLNEGFSHVRDRRGDRVFETILSVEMDPWAHRTLELRALYRRLGSSAHGKKAYRDYVRGTMTRENLFNTDRESGAAAKEEAFLGTLGERTTNDEVEERIAKALRRLRAKECVLIGGPPCQAYSLAGRSRRAKESLELFESDPKHRLYLEYLRIVRRFRPAVFVMENVPGLLSARWKGDRTFDLIREGLSGAGYRLFPLGEEGKREFVLRAEDFGVPQSRSRLFIVGVRDDIKSMPPRMTPDSGPVITVANVLNGLPKIRSKLTKEPDSAENWREAILQIADYSSVEQGEPEFGAILRERANLISATLPLGVDCLEIRALPKEHADWYCDSTLPFILNHNSRGHMRRDLLRYFFWAEFARHYSRSPTLRDAPRFLKPNHANAADKKAPFADRFRVQLPDKPSTTITSHIAKDGHYYIHADSLQCRSLSVREAARLQTFPDSYFFEGPVTEQYHQVGNAVPPLLARRIGAHVAQLFV